MWPDHVSSNKTTRTPSDVVVSARIGRRSGSGIGLEGNRAQRRQRRWSPLPWDTASEEAAIEPSTHAISEHDIVVLGERIGDWSVGAHGTRLRRHGHRRDNGLPVARAYKERSPYAFTGTVKKVVFDLTPGAHEDEQALHHHGSVHAVAAGICA